MQLASNLRDQRNSLGLTLDDLAKRSGVSRAMISATERGEKNPTINVLIQLASALGITVSRLIGEVEHPPVTVTRKNDRSIWVDAENGSKRSLLSPVFARQGVEVLWFELSAGAKLGELAPRYTRSYVFMSVVAGSLQCQVGSEEVLLEAGDSISFPATVSRQFTNPTKECCRFFAVVMIEDR